MKDNKSESEGSNKDNNEKAEKMDETKPEKENYKYGILVDKKLIDL